MSDSPAATGRTLRPLSTLREDNFNRLACPVHSANPDLEYPKSCYSGERTLSHLRAHLEKFHKCNSDCSSPCQNPLHLSASQLSDAKHTTKRHNESCRETWRKMFQRLYPGHQPIPPPFIVSLDQFEAVANYPTAETISQYASRLEAAQVGYAGDPSMVSDVFQAIPILLDVVRENGALPYTPSNTNEHGAQL